MKIKNLIIMSATLLMAAGCAKEIYQIEPEVGIIDPDAPVFTAQISEEAQTKLLLDENNHLRWNTTGDTLSVFSGTVHSKYEITNQSFGQGTVTSRVFTKVAGADLTSEAAPENCYAAAYPYNAANNYNSDGTISVVLPTNAISIGSTTVTLWQNYPMVAVTQDLNDYALRFRAVCGLLKVPVKGTGVIEKITIRGNAGENIAGTLKVNASFEGDPELVEITNPSTEISVSNAYIELYPNAEKNLYFTLPPITFSQGFTIEFTDAAGEVITKSTEESRTITRNMINSMSTVSMNCTAEVAKPFVSQQEMEDSFNDMIVSIGQPGRHYMTPSDWGLLSVLYMREIEGADMILPDSGYNWFSINCSLNRSATYRNNVQCFLIPFDIASAATRFIVSAGVSNIAGSGTYVAQAKALRAYCHMLLAQNFQFSPLQVPNALCVPIAKDLESLRYFHRSTVSEVYAFIKQDLDEAIDGLAGYVRPSKMFIDANVAHGLRARANLMTGDYQDAYNDAVAAASGYTPASIAEVSVPAFMDINEHNWIWGYDMTPEVASRYVWATTSSWLRSFSASAYSVSIGVFSTINRRLFDKIPATDVRKGWWVDDYLRSANIKGVKWTDGEDIAFADDGGNTKREYIAYTNVKFGCNPIGTNANAEDMPLMRVEEMELIKAEALARLGNSSEAIQVLETFVKTYRDPSYSYNPAMPIWDEVLTQRRIELWGEGFSLNDLIRFDKPVVRFSEGAKRTYVPQAFRFNVPARDPVLLLPFPQSVIDSYPDMVQNDIPSPPAPLSNGNLHDELN